MCVCSNTLVDVESIITNKLEHYLRYLNGDLFLSSARQVLDDMDVYAREHFFHRVYFSEFRTDWKPTVDQRWSLLELFLDPYAFAYVDVEG